MVTIRYSLTPGDYDAFETEMCSGLLKRVVRVLGASLIAATGSFALSLVAVSYRQHKWLDNLMVTSLGVFLLWMAVDFPGLRWLFHKLKFRPLDLEVRIDEFNIADWNGKKSRRFSRKPQRGFRETVSFFILQARGERWSIPKRAVTQEQELQLRELVRRASTE